MMISIDSEEAFDKIQCSFNKLGIEGNFFNMIKDIYEKPRANIYSLMKGRKFPFSLRSGTRQGCQFPLLLYNIVLGIVARAIRQEKEIKSVHFGKEEVKVSLFKDDLILYIESPKNPQEISKT